MLESILNLCFPRNCPICKAPSDRPDRHICSDCLNRLPTLPPEMDFPAAVAFEGYARDLITAFKFHGQLYFTDDLVDLMEAAAIAHYDVAKIDLVIPMPAALWHRFLRGYNQTAYLAKGLAKRIHRTCREDILRRKGTPRQQALLSGDERERNVKGTFKLNPRKLGFLKSRTVLLVDDIHTTGATCKEAAKTLKSGGAKEVLILTLAKRGD